MTVGELLAGSRAAHARYREHAGRVDHQGTVTHPPNNSGKAEEIRTAYELRLEAQTADPDHFDSAWNDDTASHADLMHFYRTYLQVNDPPVSIAVPAAVETAAAAGNLTDVTTD